MTEARTHQHTRTIRLDGFLRPDGLYDIEAHLVDVKHYDTVTPDRGTLPAGAPMHEMRVTMTVDVEGTIRGFEARTLAAPHPVCPTAAPAFSRLVGLSVNRGFLKAAAERIGGVEGCTHIRELLQPLATVAFQTMREARMKRYVDQPDRRPPMLDTCKAWSSAGDWVKVRFPRFWTGARGAADADAGGVG